VATLRCGDGSCIYEELAANHAGKQISIRILVNAIIIVHANVQPNQATRRKEVFSKDNSEPKDLEVWHI